MNKKNLSHLLIYSFVLFFLFACGVNEDTTKKITPIETITTIAQKNATNIPVPLTPTPSVLTERPGHVWLTDSDTKAGYILRSFLQIPVGMTWGPDGYLYVADWAGRHVVRVSKDKNMDDLGLWQNVKPLQEDGPRGLAFDSEGNLFINNHGHILRRDTSGTVETLPGVDGSPIGSIAISPSDELFYTDRGTGKLLKWNPNGESEVIVSDLPNAENLAFGLDGTLYLTQMGHTNVIKVDISNKTSQIFATEVCGVDPCFLTVDPEGDIWIRGIWHIHQFSPEGIEKPFIVDGETHPGGAIKWGDTSAGIAFDDEGSLWIASYNSKLVRLVPQEPGASDPEFSMEVISSGFAASDLVIDSKGAIYASDINNRQIVKINQNNEVEVLHQHGSNGRVAIAVDENDVVFLGMPNGEIVRLEADGSLTHYADLLVQRMVFGANGVLYAVTGDHDQPTSLMSITDVDTKKVLATELDGIPLGDEDIEISPALEQGLYVFTEWGRNLYFLDFEGQSQLIVNLQDLGGGGPVVMAVSPINGDIYLIPHGPYAIFQIDMNGNHQKIASGIFGDPEGLAISHDGKYLFIAESGVIDKIPLSEK
jgi:sugar lactone lactonase YvrE